MKTLNGVSEKQIAFATTMREVVLNEDVFNVLNETIKNANIWITDKTERLNLENKDVDSNSSIIREKKMIGYIEKYTLLLNELKNKTESAFFLDNHDYMIKVLRKSSGSSSVNQMSDEYLLKRNTSEAKGFFSSIDRRNNLIVNLIK